MFNVWCEVGDATYIQCTLHRCPSFKWTQLLIIKSAHMHGSASQLNSASLINGPLFESVLLSFNNCVFIAYFCMTSSLRVTVMQLVSELRFPYVPVFCFTLVRVPDEQRLHQALLLCLCSFTWLLAPACPSFEV